MDNVYWSGFFFIVALVFFLFKPKTRNGIFGYRTPQSMKNDENWKYAQKTSSRLLLIFAGFICLLIAALNYFQIILDPGLFIISALVLTIAIVEVNLKRPG